MKVSKLKIGKFRHLENIEMTFGKRLTAIAGQNGTGKSTLLGLIGHVFSYKVAGKIKHKALDKKPFETEYFEIFKFSYPKYDKPGDHSYTVESDNGDIISVQSTDRKESGRKKALRLIVGTKKRGEGKRTLPVIYLGLRRLFPLAQEDNVKQDVNLKLSKKETEKYEELHNQILMLDEIVTTEYVEAYSKKFYGTRTKNYDTLGNSAGQDNIGQILTAIFSFTQLKEKMGKKYEGGLLLIDEIDATLYPGAQMKLIEILFRLAQDLDLQIIFTTHSLDILEIILDPKYKNDADVIFLSKQTGRVENVKSEVTIKEIINDLKVLLPSAEKQQKMLVFCEDNEAKLWISNLLGTAITKKLTFIPETFGGDLLVTIANKKIPIFKNCIFVLDGDKGKALKNNRCPRVITLPGAESPEKIFYNFLKQLKDNDVFWGKTGQYTKQACFRDLNRVGDRNKMKKWFAVQKPHWGARGCSKLFSRWKRDNEKETEEFVKEFEEIIDKIS